MTIPKTSEPERWPLDRTTNQPVQQPGEKTPASQPSSPAPEPPTRDIHMATRAVQVWVDADLGIADLVEYLNDIPGVRTHTSCQGTIGEGGAEPYSAYVECSWATTEAKERLAREFSLELKGNSHGTVRLKNLTPEEPTSAPQQETIHANDCGTKYGKSCTCEGVLEALVMPEEERFQPTYYVRHPDDSYSVAEPQPRLQKPKLFKGIKCIRCKRKIKQGGMSFPYCTALCKKFAEQEARGEEAHYVEP